MNHFLATNLQGNTGTLGKEESHHATRVLRLTEGTPISVTTGDGKVHQAQLTHIHKNEVHFAVDKLIREQSQPDLHIAIAPPKKNDRFEFFLEKATELGIKRITPLLCEHSERKVYKQARGQKVLMAAVKQSKKGYIPHLDEIIPFNDFLKQNSASPLYITHLHSSKTAQLSQLPYPPNPIFLVGPEGDFNKQEIEKALEHGAQPVQLGPETLRTETAGVAITLHHYFCKS